MTSPGVKRQLDFDLPAHTSGSGGGTNPNLPVANGGNKRRCTNQFHTHQQQPQPQSRYDHIAGHTNSPFKDSSTLLAPMGDEIAAVIKDEMHRAHDNHTVNGDEVTIFTARQTQFICEKLIRDREQKLRDEYDKILACKLAEQYDLLFKPNLINPYTTDCSRLPNAATVAANAAAAALGQPAGNPSINALAAAYTSMQRSAAHATAANSTSLRDLSTFATSLTTNGHPSALTPSHLHAFNLQQQAAAAAALQAQQSHRVGSTNSSLIPSGPVLLVSNLDEQLAVPEALFTLFGVFGDVIRVKILFNKKDNALIQMADANQAQVAQGYLDKQKIFGKAIRVTRSKHQLVQMPRESNQSDAGLTKDFTNSPLHRFKIPGSRNYLNIYPPSNTLHISNIPATIDEDDLHKAFKEACGFEFSSFKFFPKDRKMAIMKFSSIEYAAIALIKMHNFQISDDNTLRVSFSKSIMQQ